MFGTPPSGSQGGRGLAKLFVGRDKEPREDTRWAGDSVFTRLRRRITKRHSPPVS